jgi:hypothetical protein
MVVVGGACLALIDSRDPKGPRTVSHHHNHGLRQTIAPRNLEAN